MKGDMRAGLTVLLTAAVMLTIGALMYVLLSKGEIYGAASALVLAVIVGLFMFLYLKGGLADAKKGMPFQDERSKKIVAYAGAKAFTLSIWWLLFLMWYADTTNILPRHVAAAGIFGMAVLFFVSWIWYEKRGVRD